MRTEITVKVKDMDTDMGRLRGGTVGWNTVEK